jgi:hypothetical protein
VTSVLAALLLLSAASVQQCVDDSEAGQVAHLKGQLLAARAAFERCAAVSCPALVVSDCTRWLDEVVAATPSVVVAVRVDNIDQRRARVLLDGHLWLEELTGHAVDLEPGAHRLTVQLDGRVLEQMAVVNVGEKNRSVVFRFDSSLPLTAPEPEVRASAPTRRSLVFPALSTGLAVVGWGAFASLGLLGRAQLDALEHGACGLARSCAPSQVADVRRLFLWADVSMVVGAAATVASALLWWWGLAAPAVAVVPTASGVSLALTGAW